MGDVSADPEGIRIQVARSRVAESHFADDGLFAASLEGLAGALMARFGGHEWRGRFPLCIDGIVFVLQRATPDGFEGHGVVVLLPGQGLEPISVELRFDPKLRTLGAATLLFGAAGPTRPCYGSPAGNRLRHDVLAGALAARQKRPFAWRHRFTLKAEAWTHEPL